MVFGTHQQRVQRSSGDDRARSQAGRGLLPQDPRAMGCEPDYRFTLANERTFLAWVRTALALSAGGLGVATLLDDVAGAALLGVGILVFSLLTVNTAYRRWALNERAIRLAEPLPPSRLLLIMSIGVSAVTIAAIALVARGA